MNQDLIGIPFGFQYVREYVGYANGHHRWITECLNCGCKSERDTNTIRKGGCRNCSNKPKGHTGSHQLYLQYKLKAKQRGRSFDLSIDQFRQITSSPCHYCGCSPAQIKQSNHKAQISTWGLYLFNGIDRKDNNLGYFVSNSLPSCGKCNFMKNNMDYNDFVSWLDKVSAFRGSK